MIRATCPICKCPIQGESINDLPTFPFCSARCRTIDQARWASDDYLVSQPATVDEAEIGDPDDGP